MSTGRIRLRVALAEHIDGDIRHARTETLRAIGGHLRPELMTPMPYAIYLLAYLSGRPTPIGLAEACFLEQHYGEYAQVPYGDVYDIPSICPFPQLASIRTVYTDPAFRLHHALYVKLILGQAHIFRSLGARYAAATTNADDERLARLYDRTGGVRLGQKRFEGLFDNPIAVYLFELDALLRHRMTTRMLRDLELDMSVVSTARARSRSSAPAS